MEPRRGAAPDWPPDDKNVSSSSREAWQFAQALLGRSVPESSGSATDQAAEQELFEWLADVTTLFEDGWDPTKHPRGAFPQNRGWFSPTGAKQAAPADGPGDATPSPQPQLTRHTCPPTTAERGSKARREMASSGTMIRQSISRRASWARKYDSAASTLRSAAFRRNHTTVVAQARLASKSRRSRGSTPTQMPLTPRCERNWAIRSGSDRRVIGGITLGRPGLR